MLIEDEGYVKPASRESRLVMVQLEPIAKNKQKDGKEPNEQEQEHTQNKSARKGAFLNSSRKHVAIGKGLMAAHAHDIRLKVRRKRSKIIGEK